MQMWQTQPSKFGDNKELIFHCFMFQDTQLTRIPPQKESCLLVQRRKETGASLRDGKHLKGKAQRLI